MAVRVAVAVGSGNVVDVGFGVVLAGGFIGAAYAVVTRLLMEFVVTSIVGEYVVEVATY